MTNHSSLIRKLRKERGLTQEQLTRGISQRGTLAAFESRGTKISFELFNRHSAILRKLFLSELKRLTQNHKQSIDLAQYKLFAALDRLADGDHSAIPEIEKGLRFFEWLDLTNAKEYFNNLKNLLIESSLKNKAN